MWTDVDETVRRARASALLREPSSVASPTPSAPANKDTLSRFFLQGLSRSFFLVAHQAAGSWKEEGGPTGTRHPRGHVRLSLLSAESRAARKGESACAALRRRYFADTTARARARAPLLGASSIFTSGGG